MANEEMQDEVATGEPAAAQAETQDVNQKDAPQEDSATSEKANAEDSKEAKAEAENTDDQQKKHGAEKRINQLTWKAREAERRADELEQRLKEISEQQQPKRPDLEFPTLESVGYDEKAYQEAVAGYYAAQVDTALTQKEQQRQNEKAEQDIAKKARDFYEKGVALADDFDELVMQNKALPVTEAMRDALFAIDKGPEVLYHLANNPDEAFRVANLSPYAQAVEIGRLEARMSMPKPKTTTSAPPPITPLSGGGESVNDPNNANIDDWMKRRNAEVFGN